MHKKHAVFVVLQSKKAYNRHILTSSAIMAMSAELLLGIWTLLAIWYDYR